MKSKNFSRTWAGAIISAFAASLCCITPISTLIVGISGITSAFSWIEPIRPYLIALSIGALLFAWYMKLKPSKNDLDCNCETTSKTSFFQSKAFLAIVTVFAMLIIAFPLYAKIFYSSPKVASATTGVNGQKEQIKFEIQGMTCEACEGHINHELSKVAGVLAYKTSYADQSSLVTFDKSKVDVKAIKEAINKTGYVVKAEAHASAFNENLLFYRASLVCQAAPSIGCGSKAKFLLVDLEKNVAIEGAWLNRKGTIVAIKWAKVSDEVKRNELKAITSKHNSGLTVLAQEETAAYVKSFPGTGWFKGEEVDKLSKEEAAIIARKTIEGYKESGLIKPSFEKQFQLEIENIYANLFLSISSYRELNVEAYNRIENQIQKAGEKYLGKGKMPHVELCKSRSLNELSPESCSTDKSCSSEKTNQSCCEKN